MLLNHYALKKENVLNTLCAYQEKLETWKGYQARTPSYEAMNKVDELNEVCAILNNLAKAYGLN